MPKAVIGENWKGIGNSYVDDQLGYAVDCLNVMASKDGKWLRSRPGFKDAGINTANQIMGLAVYDKVDDNNTLGWALYNGGTSPSQIKYDGSTNIAAVVTNSDITVHKDWADDIANSQTYQYGPISGISHTDMMFNFGRSWNWFSLWSKNGYTKSDVSKLYLPLVSWQGQRLGVATYQTSTDRDNGIYGLDRIIGNPTLTEITTSGDLTSSKEYQVTWQFLVKDKNNRIVAYSTPQTKIDFIGGTYNGNITDKTLTASGTGLQVSLPYRSVSFHNELGWKVKYTSTSNTDTVNRGWMYATHVRIFRTSADQDVLYQAEEFVLGEIPTTLWRDDTGTYANVFSAPAAVDPVNLYLGQKNIIIDERSSIASSTKITKSANWESFVAAAGRCWIYDSGRIWYKYSTATESPTSNYSYIAGEIIDLKYQTLVADTSLITEYEQLHGCPSLCWLGEMHENRLFAFSSDLRTAWNGTSDIWYSLPGNYTIFQPTNYLQIGNGDIPTCALSMNGTGSMFVLTDQNAYILSGSTSENFTLSKIGSNCGCFSYKGAARHGNRIAWFGDRELWISEGGSPLNVTPILLPKYLKAIDSTASVHSGFGCYYNGQLWYRKTSYTTAASTKKGFVYDFDLNTVWPVDRTIEAVRDTSATTARFSFNSTTYNYSWSEQSISDTNDAAFCLYRRTATNAPVSIGQFKLTDHAKNEYNHYDQTWSSGTTWTNTEITRYWISPWYSMGQSNEKKIEKVRIVASPETKVNLTVEGSRDWTENTTKVPNARTVQLSGGTSEWMKLPVEVRGRYIRFRLEGVGTEKFDVKNIEFDYEVIA